jgi:hypothetical protein
MFSYSPLYRVRTVQLLHQLNRIRKGYGSQNKLRKKYTPYSPVLSRVRNLLIQFSRICRGSKPTDKLYSKHNDAKP